MSTPKEAPQKHDVNLQKNSTLYFQVGLIICLLAAYGLLEMTFESTTATLYTQSTLDDGLEEIAIENFEVYKEPMAMAKPEPPIEPVDNTLPPDIIDNLFENDPPEDNIPTEATTDTDAPLSPGDLNVEKIPEEADVDITVIEQVPIYPGCEKMQTNLERRNCMSDKINKLIQRKFDMYLGGELGLSGKQVIYTQFKIDKTGHVADIKILRAPHPDLGEEAKRVINFIPNMIPGKQRDQNVGVRYTLPIVFQAGD